MSSSPASTSTIVRSGPWSNRYSMIDAWRGLAALGVVLHHLWIGSSFNLGHICVMVFFVISGYCIAASSESCLRNNVGFQGFMWRRLRRIYPPYFFAVLFFLLTRFAKKAVGAGNQISTSVLEWVQNLTLTQWTHLTFHPTSFPSENTHLFVAAFWSLNYEEQFYLLMALFSTLALAFKIPIQRSVVLMLVPCAIWNVLFPSTSYGPFFEYWVHFGIGVMVFYRLCRQMHKTTKILIDAGLVALAAISALMWYLHPTDLRWVYKEWAVVSIFALLLIFLRRWDDAFQRNAVGKALVAFGVITYSLYLTHQFNLRPTRFVAEKIAAHGILHPLIVPVQIAELIVLATVFWFFCERPFLNRPLAQNTNQNTKSSGRIVRPANQEPISTRS